MLLQNIDSIHEQMGETAESRVQHLITMLTMQNANNDIQHNPLWAHFDNSVRADYRMALIELGEVWDHLPSGQWWKKGDQTEAFLDLEQRDQAALEIVDAMHFALSHTLRTYIDDPDHTVMSEIIPDIASLIASVSMQSSVVYEDFLRGDFTVEQIMGEFNSLIDTAIINSNFEVFPLDSATVPSNLLSTGPHQSFTNFWSSVFLALHLLDYSFEQVVALYVTKNRLNTFRVKNGYTKKAGEDRYIKLAYDGGSETAPVEDNHHVPAMARSAAEATALRGSDLTMEIDNAIIAMYRNRLGQVWGVIDAIASSSEEEGESRITLENQTAFPAHWLLPVGGWSLVSTNEGLAYHNTDKEETVLYQGVHPHFAK
ncbi:nucleoside triphosphate pyrophosphohydrolase [Pseudomonas phage vB_PpuM-Illi-2]